MNIFGDESSIYPYPEVEPYSPIKRIAIWFSLWFVAVGIGGGMVFEALNLLL